MRLCFKVLNTMPQRVPQSCEDAATVQIHGRNTVVCVLTTVSPTQMVMMMKTVLTTVTSMYLWLIAQTRILYYVVMGHPLTK